MKKFINYKRVLGMALGFALMVTGLPLNVSAEEAAVTVATENVTASTDIELDNDALFAGYVEQNIFGMGGDIATFATLSKDRLSLTEQAVYTALKDAVSQVAEKGGNTQFVLDVTGAGVTFKVEGIDGSTASGVYNIDVSKIMDALLIDCPYELYWFNKKAGYSYGGALPGGIKVGDVVDIATFAIYLKVAATYQKDGNEYTVSNDKITAAIAAKVNADNVIAEASRINGTFDKLSYFLDYIKNNVAYEHNYGEADYGDIWQMIWVFDGKSATNVVCEGYAKAFKYLCDGIDVECYTVTGGMGSLEDANDWGPHMWNIVVLDGKSYLVDVTNCDEGSAGSVNNDFFMKAPIVGDGINTRYQYTISNSNIYFWYDQYTLALFGDDPILSLCTDDYFEDGMGKPCGYTVSLNGNIGLNFYMKLANSVVNSDDAKMVFTLPNGTAKEVKVNSVDSVTNAGETYYIFSCDVAAKEMADDIQAQIVVGEQKGTVYTYSVKEYADYILANPNLYQNAIPLVKAMLNYGAYSQTYFNYNIGKLANAGLSAGDATLADVTASSLETYKAEKVANDDVCTFNSAYLSLNSETKVAVKVKLANGVSNAEFYIGENHVECSQSGDYYVLSVDNVKAHSLDDMYDFKVVANVNGAQKQATLRYGALSYCRTALNGSYDPKLQNVVKALCLYNAAANVYSNN